jgi:endonuclease/exonuclease/phosphatase family metal-dependent hydrolase
MKVRGNYWLWAVVCLVASVPLALYLLARRGGPPVVRFATWNVALNRPQAGALLAELRGGGSVAGRQIAELVQRLGIDVLLLNEVDRDEAGEVAAVLRREYFGTAQGGQRAIDYPFWFQGAVNTGEPTGRDLDRDGKSDGPADAFGYGAFPGQYGMLLLSRHPILTAQIRTFRQLAWSAMPDAMRPAGHYDDATWQRLRLSSKSHWDVPIGIGDPARGGRVVHALCSHPTPPAFDGPEDRNGCRNHDEIRFWVDYLTPGRSAWIVDDGGGRGGLGADAAFVVLGDLNCDPVDGDARREALAGLLAHPRVRDPLPKSRGGSAAALQQFGSNQAQRGDAAFDTGDFDDRPPAGPGNLRVDYALPSADLKVAGSGVFWPLAHEPGAKLVEVSDHRLVWLDLRIP